MNLVCVVTNLLYCYGCLKCVCCANIIKSLQVLSLIKEILEGV